MRQAAFANPLMWCTVLCTHDKTDPIAERQEEYMRLGFFTVVVILSVPLTCLLQVFLGSPAFDTSLHVRWTSNLCSNNLLPTLSVQHVKMTEPPMAGISDPGLLCC